MKRVHAVLLGVMLSVAGCGTPTTPVDLYSSIDIEVAGEHLAVWLANDSNERQSGLMGVEQLPESIDGMLFTWPAPVSATFHMENTLLALDIWWFDSDGLLIGSAAMEPGIDVSYRSPGPVGWALETPVGMFRFQLGDLLSTVETG